MNLKKIMLEMLHRPISVCSFKDQICHKHLLKNFLLQFFLLLVKKTNKHDLMNILPSLVCSLSLLLECNFGLHIWLFYTKFTMKFQHIPFGWNMLKSDWTKYASTSCLSACDHQCRIELISCVNVQ